jgi:hypothetical protein
LTAILPLIPLGWLLVQTGCCANLLQYILACSGRHAKPGKRSLPDLLHELAEVGEEFLLGLDVPIALHVPGYLSSVEQGQHSLPEQSLGAAHD